MHDHEALHEGERSHRGGGRRHHGDFGPPWARHMREWGVGPPRGARRRRGDVRTAVLAMLDEKPAHGYDLIRELEQRSGGMWQPSPGSVYPTLQMLEDEGLLTSEEVDGKRVYSITDQGRAELAERRSRSGNSAPWEMRGGPDEGAKRLFGAMSQLAPALMQVARAGNPQQIDRVTEIVAEARKKVYAVLAED